MLAEFFHDLLVSAVGFALVALGGLVWRLLRKVPFVMVGLGAAALAVAAVLAMSMGSANFRTEGSPAGTILFIVMGTGIVGFGLIGLVFVVRGFADAADASSTQMALSFGVATAAVLAVGLWSTVGQRPRAEASRPRIEVPERPRLATADLASSRRVQVGDAYSVSWKARDNAPAQQLLVPAAELQDERGLMDETADGLRTLHVLVDTGSEVALVKMHRDSSTLSNDAYAALYGRLPRKLEAPSYMRVSQKSGEWKVLGLECPAGAEEAHPALARAHAVACRKPGSFAESRFPGRFGPERARFHAEAFRGGCRFAYVRRGRPVEFSVSRPCYQPEGLDAIEAVERAIASYEAVAPPLAPQRLAAAERLVERCEQGRDAATCRLAARLVRAEDLAQPEQARALLARLGEVAPREVTRSGVARRPR